MKSKSIKKQKSLSLFNQKTQNENSVCHHLPSDFVKLERWDVSKQPKSIYYELMKSQFGELLVASTSKGVYYLDFYKSKSKAIQRLNAYFPFSEFIEQSGYWQTQINVFFTGEVQNNIQTIPLYLKGTAFQFQVWNELLNIPFGELSTYGEIAQCIGKPNSSRAVGTAIGNNPIAYIIPCHRVVQKSGKLGGYKWGIQRKKEILAWEAMKISS